jgi:hypothetical protein
MRRVRINKLKKMQGMMVSVLQVIGEAEIKRSLEAVNLRPNWQI